jgi:hypothetical protein
MPIIEFEKASIFASNAIEEERREMEKQNRRY